MARASVRIYQPQQPMSNKPYLLFQKATDVEVRQDILTFKTESGKVVHTNLPFLCIED